MGTGSFPGVEAGGRGADPHLVPKVLEKCRTIPLPTLRACVTYKMCENLPFDAFFITSRVTLLRERQTFENAVRYFSFFIRNFKCYLNQCFFSLMEVNNLWFIFWIKLQVTAEIQGLEKCIFSLNNKLQSLIYNYSRRSNTPICLRRFDTVRSNGRHYCYCRCFTDAEKFFGAKKKDDKEGQED